MLKKIRYIIGKKNWIKYLVLVVFMLIAAAIDTLLTYVIYPFVTLIMGESSTMELLKVSVSNGQNDKRIIAIMAIGIALAYILRNAFMLALNRYKFRYLAKCRASVSQQLFKSFTNKKYAFFTETNTATIQRICVEDVIRFFRLLESILDLIINLATMFAVLLVLATSNFVLTLLCVFLAGGLSVIVNRAVSGRIRKMSLLHTKCYTNLLQVVQQFTGNVKSIFVNNRQGFYRDRFEEDINKVAEIASDNSFLSTMSGYITNAVMMSVVFGYMGIVSYKQTNLVEQLPILALFALGAMKIMPCISSVAVSINNIKYNEIALEYVYNNISIIDKKKQESGINKTENVIILENEIDILVNNISFKFEDAQSDLFTNLTLHIPKRKMIAFVGSTGSGKTTLADIILGLQIPYYGNVLVNGKNIAEHREWWAAQIGYIPQSIYLNEASIIENVAFGESEEAIDEDRVKDSLRKACLLEFVENLPDGLKTVTGENGVKLSGGQRQRIGIARALYRNPSFLVLDEATSALDVDTEKNIMDTINSLAGEMTILIIAHRLSTIEKCDYVYRIENGKVELIEL